MPYILRSCKNLHSGPFLPKDGRLSAKKVSMIVFSKFTFSSVYKGKMLMLYITNGSKLSPPVTHGICITYFFHIRSTICTKWVTDKSPLCQWPMRTIDHWTILTADLAGDGGEQPTAKVCRDDNSP
jgi:hypothetical protein